MFSLAEQASAQRQSKFFQSRAEIDRSPSESRAEVFELIAGSFKRLQAADPERGVPPWRANIGHKRNYTIQNGTAIPAASAATVAFTQQQYRISTAGSANPLPQFPNGPEMSLTTWLQDEASATDLGAYYITGANALYSSRRDVISFEIPLELVDGVSVSFTTFPPFTMTGIDGLVMGKPVTVSFSRYSGTLRLIGFQVNIARGVVELTLWG